MRLVFVFYFFGRKLPPACLDASGPGEKVPPGDAHCANGFAFAAGSQPPVPTARAGNKFARLSSMPGPILCWAGADYPDGSGRASSAQLDISPEASIV